MMQQFSFVWRRHIQRTFDRLRGRADFERRYDVTNFFIRKFGYRSYLEIGLFRGKCFRHVRCWQKTGVDPNPLVVRPGWDIRRVTSDAFFADNTERFDIVFIDGLHLAEQVVRDVYNSLACLNPGGAVLLHDCSPADEASQARDMSRLYDGKTWNGDVWNAFAFIRATRRDLFCRVLDVDQGIGIVIPRDEAPHRPLTPTIERQAREFADRVSWSDLNADRVRLLGLIGNRLELESELRTEGLENRMCRRAA